ncbi:MAG: tetratricopeptide repeat protein [Chitinophagales bacterium]|nr:tetratricopeptide repeat protein [Chitinophagales bacterium]
MRKSLCLFIAIFAIAIQLNAAYKYDYNKNCQSAYQAIFKLKFQEGKTLLDAEKKANPSNLMPYFIENYIDFFTLYIGEDEKQFNTLEENKEKRIDMLEKGDKNSPWYLYTKADLHLQWAFTRIKFGEYFNAVMEVKKASGLHKENLEKFPDFKPSKKSMAVLNTIFGAIPDKYKFGAKILGLKGSIPEGIKELKAVINDPAFQFKEEAMIMYTLLELHLVKNYNEAWQMVNGKVALGDNLLNHFVVATVASHVGKNDKVIEVLSAKPGGAAYFPYPFLDFLLGNAKLNRLDKDADVPIKKFLANFKGKNYIKDANRKLAWFYLINSQPDVYKKYMTTCKSVGATVTDEDISAQKEAESGTIPNKELLKARVLFDGGYYQKAYDQLIKLPAASFTKTSEKIEYQYRKGRILHEWGKPDEAIPAYLEAIKLSGTSTSLYFAPNSALKLGMIYEKKGNKTKAAEYYKKAMSYPTHEYKNSVDAEAKAGLNRIGM